MVILRVSLEVFREIADALAQDRHLNLWRSGVGLMRTITADEIRLPVLRQRHDCLHERPSTSGARARPKPPYTLTAMVNEISMLHQDEEGTQNAAGPWPGQGQQVTVSQEPDRRFRQSP